jgi:hypothetical protein
MLGLPAAATAVVFSNAAGITRGAVEAIVSTAVPVRARAQV